MVKRAFVYLSALVGFGGMVYLAGGIHAQPPGGAAPPPAGQPPAAQQARPTIAVFNMAAVMRDYGKAKGYDLGQNPTNSVLALFPGALIIVPALVTYWRGTKRVMGASRLAGQEPLNGWIAIILYVLIAPALWAYIQVSLNDVWQAEADAVAGELAPPVPSDQMPPPLQQEPPAGEPPVADPPPPGSAA